MEHVQSNPAMGRVPVGYVEQAPSPKKGAFT